MRDSDYYVKMLRIYFNDNNITGKKKYSLLDNNPFDGNFTKWEENYIKGNKLIAEAIKNNNLIKNIYFVDELTGNDDESISKYLGLENNYGYSKTPKLTIVHDNLRGNTSYLPNIIKDKPHFILGIATKDFKAYQARVNYYDKIIKNNKSIKIIESYRDDNNICIIHK